MTLRRAAMVLASGLLGALLLAPTQAIATPLVSPAQPGYWLAGADGGIFSFNAPFYGSGTSHAGTPGTCSFTPQSPSALPATLGCSALAATPSGHGYWLLNAFRQGIPFGQGAGMSPLDCTSPTGATGRWTGIASSTTGAGYWATSSNGGVLACGDAIFLGGVASLALNGPVVGIAATPDGEGYWLVAADGGVFAFGDAAFLGSMGGKHLNAPMVGIAGTPDGKGYWLAASDGGVFSFGTAPFEGSIAGTTLSGPIVGIAGYSGSGPG
jgi:hypothetical protein